MAAGQEPKFTWPDRDTSVTVSNCTSYTQYLSSNDKCCGLHGSDVFIYGRVSVDKDGFEVKTGIRGNPVSGNELSDRNVIATFDPRSISLAYVYDNFKWDHCGAEGHDFNIAWGGTVPSPRECFYKRDEPLSTLYTSFEREMSELMTEKEDPFYDR